jgi:hypothetical protein
MSTPTPKLKIQTRTFSIIGERTNTWLPPIPWAMLQPYERRAQANHGGQTLERLHARGGLSPAEALMVLKDLPCHGPEWDRLMRLSYIEQDRELRTLVKERLPHMLTVGAAACTHPERPEVLDNRGLKKCPNCGKLIPGDYEGMSPQHRVMFQ